MKDKLRYIAKNILGECTNRKLVAFSIDDYGTQRTASKQARENLIKAGFIKEHNRFDMFDSLECADDLELLFQVLSSVKDKNGHSAVFTPFALTVNPDFETMAQERYARYVYEILPETYQKVHGDTKTWEVIKQGIQKGIFLPQYHGREHMNIKTMMSLLQRRDKCAILNFQNNSYSSIKSPFTDISATAEFDFVSSNEIPHLGEVAKDGLRLFEQVYGYKAKHFSAPGNRENRLLDKYLAEGGIELLDSDFVRKVCVSNGKYKYLSIDYNGKKNHFGQRYIVRNVVFEPMAGYDADPLGRVMNQIDIAFSMYKPANISTHRVNFSGTIDKAYRDRGLRELKKLLDAIVKKYPDVEFITTTQIIKKNR